MNLVKIQSTWRIALVPLLSPLVPFTFMFHVQWSPPPIPTVSVILRPSIPDISCRHQLLTLFFDSTVHFAHIPPCFSLLPRCPYSPLHRRWSPDSRSHPTTPGTRLCHFICDTFSSLHLPQSRPSMIRIFHGADVHTSVPSHP